MNNKISKNVSKELEEYKPATHHKIHKYFKHHGDDDDIELFLFHVPKDV